MATAKHHHHDDQLAQRAEVPDKPNIRTIQARTHEKLASDDPRLRPTVPYALTISKITAKMLNQGSVLKSAMRPR